MECCYRRVNENGKSYVCTSVFKAVLVVALNATFNNTRAGQFAHLRTLMFTCTDRSLTHGHSRERIGEHDILRQKVAILGGHCEADVVRVANTRGGDVQLAVGEALVAQEHSDALQSLSLSLVDGHREGCVRDHGQALVRCTGLRARTCVQGMGSRARGCVHGVACTLCAHTYAHGELAA